MRALFLVPFVLLAACGEESRPPPREPATEAQPPKEEEPSRIWVDRILIAFEGNAQGLESHRPKARARELAYDLLKRLRAAAAGKSRLELLSTFAVLKQQYSDDPAKEARVPYVLCNYGVQPRPRRDGKPEIPRGVMFGQVPWKLQPGELGIVDYDPKIAPAGWDVVIRLK